jgi:hypothetical protein
MSNFPVGFEGMLLGFVDPTTGAFLGQASTLANGSSSPAFWLDNIVSAGLQQVAQEDLISRGGDRQKISTRFGNPKLAPFDVQVSDMNRTLIAAVERTTINTVSSVFTKYGDNPNRVASDVFACLFWQRFPGDDGSNKYHFTVLPKAEVRYRRGAMEYRGESLSTLSINPLTVNKHCTQQSFGSSGLNFGFEGDKADHFFFEADYPVHWIGYRRTDALALNLTTTYRPLSSVITLNATQNENVVNGAAAALTSINTTSGAYVVAAGGAAGDYGMLQHTTAFVPV